MLSCRAAGNRKAAFPEMSYLVFIEFMAVIVGAIYGVLLAARKGMDIMGVFAVAFAVAFGGGTLRDLFLSRDPLFWIGNPHYPVIVFAIALFSGEKTGQQAREIWLVDKAPKVIEKLKAAVK